MFRHHWPAFGAVIALGLFFAAAAVYPGGTLQSPTTVGFRWTENFICALFAANALNGEANPARQWAIPAMWLLCLCLGTVYWRISRLASTRWHRTAIEIGGPGAMAYAAFVVTPIHDLVVSIGLVFGLVALLATMHMLHSQGRRVLVGWGGVCLAQMLVSGTLYYNGMLDGGLALLQKIDWLTMVGWLFAIHSARARR